MMVSYNIWVGGRGGGGVSFPVSQGDARCTGRQY